MTGKKRQIFNIFNNLISRLRRVKKQGYYFFFSVLLGLVGILFFCSGVLTITRFIVSCVAFGGCKFFWFLAVNTPQESKAHFEDNSKIGERNIHMNGGNYNQSIQGNYIQGDYIKIQDCYINTNQELSEVVAEFRDVVTQLKNQGYSAEKAEVQVAKDLEEQARSNPKVKKRLFKWRKSLNNPSNTRINDEADAAREVIKYAVNSQYSSSAKSTYVASGKYYKLSSLLEARKWKEADEETENLILDILGKEQRESAFLYNFLSGSDVEILPGKDLNIINKLWVDNSNKRFGFSVQKRIWESVVGTESDEKNYYPYQQFHEHYKQFGKRVGWYVKGDWIYYSDIKHSPTSLHGHLPIKVMLKIFSKKCDCDGSIFSVFMKRQYYS
jgi:hypothetical protein